MSAPAEEVDVEVSAPVHARRMLGRYEIIAEIAKGGMGTVYLARLEGAGGFERLMAVKLMHEHLAEDDDFVTMLLDEARTAANIHHPNAVGITDVAESPLGHYLVMDYVDGFPLSHVITHPELVTKDRIRIGMRLLADAAHGLHAAHTAKNAKGEKLGIVHRDVSPQNVLVGTDGMARIVDFGIALAASRVAASRPGSLKGKPQYMAPEQAKGEPCDPRTDVFALGVIAWEILTYERLFFGEMDVAILVQVMECNVPSPLERDPNLPAGLAATAMKALGRRPEDRFATARDFAVALERAAEAAGMLATTHEVEEIVGRLFAEEIEAKNAAVRQHLSRSGGAPIALRKGELGVVSKLFDKKLMHRPRVEMKTRTGGPGTPTTGSGVRERGHEMQLEATMTNTPLVTPAPPGSVPDWTGRVATEKATPAAPPDRRVGLGAVLALIGLVSIAVAVGTVLMSGGRAPATAATDTTPPPPVVAAPPPPPATAREDEPVVALPTAEPVVAAPSVAPAPDPVIAPAPEPSASVTGSRPGGRPHGRPATDPVVAAEPTPAPTPAPTPTPTTSPSTPTLEANPYH